MSKQWWLCGLMAIGLAGFGCKHEQQDQNTPSTDNSSMQPPATQPAPGGTSEQTEMSVPGTAEEPKPEQGQSADANSDQNKTAQASTEEPSSSEPENQADEKKSDASDPAPSDSGSSQSNSSSTDSNSADSKSEDSNSSASDPNPNSSSEAPAEQK